MTEQLYPRRDKTPSNRKARRRYHVHYDGLIMEGGGHGCWTGYHHTYVGARIAAWWNTHIATYGGGTVTLEDRESRS